MLAAKLLRLLLAEPGKSTNMVAHALRLGNGRNKRLLSVCEAQDWLEWEQGPNRMQCWERHQGRAEQWLRGQPE